ncbi:hypothetical protein V6N13_058219 [Hibiscus sabdariffa]|uniref:Heptahelical transmembrane protein 1-like n=1 Tax=Hibiscus sabdariffa TaxID=183260 RepID=A0ABR2GGT3_9ROSI
MDPTLESKLVSDDAVDMKNGKKLGHDDDRLQVSNKDENRSSSYVLVSYKELPEYMKDNEFILNYYRANWSLKEALFSIFRWHNETLNVWTHLLGFLLFLGLTMANLLELPQLSDLITFLTRSFLINGDANVSHDSKGLFLGITNLIDFNRIATPEMDIDVPVTPVTRWPFYVFLGGSLFCLLSSSVCHLFSCHSHHLNLTLLRLDYAGITAMIITSFFPPVYYIFQCDPLWQFVYLGGITSLGLFTILTLLSPTLSTGKFRSFRALLFTSMGLFGIIPGLHAAIVNWSNPRRNVTLAYESAMATFYLTGTMFYVTRIPERLKPGWFDLTGHSHQIFHVLVVMGALAHYGASLEFLEWRDRNAC